MRYCILFISLFTLLSASAKTVKGSVSDAVSNEMIVGATISADGSSVKTVTGLDGSFKVDVPDNTKSITCTYIGYKAATQSVTNTSTVDFKLEEDAVNLTEVVVTGRNHGRSETSAMLIEKNSSNVLNIMSARSIELSPDVTVANVMQRISGVTMEKDASGEASYAILRGMDKRYNYTLVNGMKIPSPSDKNRYIPLNMFPSDLMDRLVVSKSLTADMEGDATGGVVNMIMKDAPNRLSIQANASVGYSDYFLHGNNDYLSYDYGNLTGKAPYEQYGPEYNATGADFAKGATKINRHSASLPNINAGLSIGNRILNDKLGFIVAGSFQNRYRGANRSFYLNNMAWGEQAVGLYKGETRKYSYHDIMGALHAKLDYTIDNHKIEWYNMYISSSTATVRISDIIQYQYGYEPEKGNYSLDNEFRTNRQTQNIFSTNLKGTHNLFGNLTIDWSAMYANAREKDPDRCYINITNTVENNQIVKSQIDASPGMERRFQHNNDDTWVGAINFTYNTDFGFANAAWKAGGIYRKKERDNRYYSYQFRAVNDMRDDNSFEGFEDVEWTVRTPRAQASQLNYDSKENIGGSYAMVTLSNKWGELVAGFRAEHTNQLYTMLQRFDNLGPVGEQSYWDYLPSVALKYSPTNEMNIRLSYYKSINRPSFYEVVPFKIMGDDYDEAGNPNLRRARIQNVDFRWEWFPSSNEQILVGMFYKHLKDPIEMAFDQPDGRNLIYTPKNLGNANNYGVEIDLVKYIRHFGIKANYTYTHSNITTTKKENEIGTANCHLVSQDRPLVNQAPHTANLSLLYKDTQYGWNAQLAGAYTGDRIAVVSQFKNADQWDKGTFSLDFSAEKKFQNGISIFLKANNLTDTKNERFVKTINEKNFNYPGQRTDRTVIGTYRYGRNFLLGFRYTL